jgi:hypothetical protein
MNFDGESNRKKILPERKKKRRSSAPLHSNFNNAIK